jgi:hypothetical protein
MCRDARGDGAARRCEKKGWDGSNADGADLTGIPQMLCLAPVGRWGAVTGAAEVARRGRRGGEASGVGLWSAPGCADHNPRSPREGATVKCCLRAARRRRERQGNHRLTRMNSNRRRCRRNGRRSRSRGGESRRERRGRTALGHGAREDQGLRGGAALSAVRVQGASAPELLKQRRLIKAVRRRRADSGRSPGRP